MRTLLLAALVAVAVAISDEDISVFRPGKEFVYDFASQALTGIPHMALQFSGLKIKATARLQIGSSYRAVLKLDDIKILTINDKIHKQCVEELCSDEVFQPLDAERHQLYAGCLQEPVKFRYDQGIVSKLEVEEEEPEWCSNIKKGVLSLFQLDLNQEHQIEDVLPAMADIVMQNRVSWDKAYDNVYRVMEESVDGECESIYAMKEPVEAVNSKASPELKLMKIRNYDNCKFRPAYEEGIFGQLGITNPEMMSITIRSFSHMDYELKGDRSNFAIKSMKQRAQHILTPMAQENGEVATFIVQELKVREVQDTVNVIQTPRSTRSVPEGLKLTFEEKLESPINSNKWAQMEAKTEVIDELLTEYVKKCSPVVSEDAPEILHKISFLLRSASTEELMSIARKLTNEAKASTDMEEKVKEKKLKTFVDLIPTVGHADIIPVVKMMIEESVIGPMEAASAINCIALTIRPTVEVIKALLPSSELSQLKIVESTPMLRGSIILALGSVTYKLSKAKKAEYISRNAYESITNQIVEELQELYSKSPTEEDKISVLKAIGNSGSPAFLKFVVSQLEEKSAPHYVRMNAVFALRRMPQELSRKIQAILLSIYMNPNELPDLRSIAYMGLMHTKPSYGVLQAIIHSLKEERSLKVGAFVYSHLQDIAGSSRSTFDYLRKNVQILIKHAKPVIPKSFISNTYAFDAMPAYLGIGSFFDLYLIDSPSTIFPYGIVGKLGVALFGKEVSLIEAGSNIKGLEEILSRLVGPKSILRELLADESPISKDILAIIKEVLLPQRQPDMGKVEASIWKVIEELGLSERVPEEMKYTAYLKVLGNELRHFIVRPQDIPEFIQNTKAHAYDLALRAFAELQKGHKLNMISSFAARSVLMIPTPLGIPLYFNYSNTFSMRLSGYIKLSGDPFSLLTKPAPLKLETDLLPSAAHQMVGTVGLQLPLLNAGVAVKYKLVFKAPIPLVASFEPERKTVAFKYLLPEKTDQIVKVEVAPISYLQTIHPETTEVFEFIEKEITNSKLVKPVLIKESNNFLGMKMEHNFDIPTPLVSFTPTSPLNGKYSYALMVSPMTSGEKYIELKAQLPAKASASKDWRKAASYHSASRSEESLEAFTEEKFEVVTPDHVLNEAKERSILLSLVTQNIPREVEMYGKITLLTDKSFLKYQLNVQGREEGSSAKVFTNIVLDLPRIAFPEKEVLKPELVAKVELGYGVKSFTDKYTSIKVLTGDKEAKLEVPVEPQGIYLSRMFLNIADFEIKSTTKVECTPSKSSWRSWLFGGKYSVQEEGLRDDDKMARCVMPIPEALPYAYKYTVEVDYRRVPETVQAYIESIFQTAAFMKSNYVVNITKEEISTPGQVTIIARVLPSMEKLHLLVDTPMSEVIMFIPARFTSLKRSLTLDCAYLAMDDDETEPWNEVGHGSLGAATAKSSFTGKCAISENMELVKTVVSTFDQLSFALPELSEDCEVVLAKDCTSSSLFTVLLSKKEGIKTLNILLPKTEITILAPQSQSSKVKAIINGEEVTIYDGEKKKVEIELQNDRPVIAQVIKDGKLVTIALEKLGLHIAMDDQDISIQSSPLHSGYICGICGDYNGEVTNELTGAKAKLHKTVEEMILSYVVPSQNCDVAEISSKNNIMNKENTFWSKEQVSCEPEKRTLVPNHYEGGEEVICLSINPVSVCPSKCRPVEEMTLRVAFHCLPGYSAQTRRLVDESKRRPLYELASKDTDRYLDIKIPQSCEPVY